MAEQLKIVEFRVGDRSFALPAHSVAHVLRAEPWSLPDKAELPILGEFEVESEKILILDGRHRLGLDSGTSGDTLIVVATNNTRCALLVDEILGVVLCDPAEAKSAEGPSGPQFDKLRIGVVNGRTVLLDPDLLVPNPVVSEKHAA